MMMLVSLVLDIQILVDSGNILTIALVPGRAIVFVDETVELVVFSLPFRFFKSFLCCCSLLCLSGGFVSSINCNSLIVGVRLGLISLKLILFCLSLCKTIVIISFDLSMGLFPSIIRNETLWLTLILIILISIDHSVTADLHGTTSRI